ncbi:hypothetical protein ACM66B_004882 [Microbotryomycetes sp. NB124-2]
MRLTTTVSCMDKPVRKKHLAQNKEIIHKNSELNKTNAELNRTLTLLRAERLSLKGSHFQLECENASLRTQVDRAQQRQAELELRLERLQQRHGTGTGVDQEQIDIMRQSLVNAVASLQACLSILPLPSNVPSDAPSTPPPRSSPTEIPHGWKSSAEASSSRHDQAATDSTNVSISRRRSLANKQARPSITALPDLSHISEGAEGSAEEYDRAGQDNEGAGRDGGGGANWWGGPILEGLREETGSQPVSAQTSPVQLSSISSMASPVPAIDVDMTVSPSNGPGLQNSGRFNNSYKRKKAPPAAPSASAARDYVERRPPRRASGLLKKPLASSSLHNGDESLDEEEEEDDDDEDFVVSSSVASKSRAGPTTISAGTSREGAIAPLTQRSRPVKSSITQAAKLVKQSQRTQATAMTAGASLEKMATGDDRTTAETVTGSVKARTSRKVQALDAVNEEAAAVVTRSELAGVEDGQDHQGGAEGGRRARKSVNYALPKLNTKMRRPEDYVPQTYAASHSKGGGAGAPRKSTKTPLQLSLNKSTGSSSTENVSATGVDENDKPENDDDGDDPTVGVNEDGSVDSFDEMAFLKKRASSTTRRQSSDIGGGAGSNLTLSRAGNEIEEKRRDRLAVKNGLLNGASRSGGGGAGGRRHSTAV